MAGVGGGVPMKCCVGVKCVCEIRYPAWGIRNSNEMGKIHQEESNYLSASIYFIPYFRRDATTTVG